MSAPKHLSGDEILRRDGFKTSHDLGHDDIARRDQESADREHGDRERGCPDDGEVCQECCDHSEGRECGHCITCGHVREGL